MKDRLENFIENNREAFDDANPPKHLWTNIDQALLKESNKRIIPIYIQQWMGKAAIGLLLIGLGTIIGINFNNAPNPELVVENQTILPQSLGDISTEYADLEKFYQKQIARQVSLLNDHPQKKDILKDIAELELNFKELKQELGSTKEDEQIIRAMIENYQTKIEILERVLNQINQPKKSKRNESII